MKSYESTKVLRYSSSKILSTLWTGFAISWDRLCQGDILRCIQYFSARSKSGFWINLLDLGPVKPEDLVQLLSVLVG
jgi:hypothetical protein